MHEDSLIPILVHIVSICLSIILLASYTRYLDLITPPVAISVIYNFLISLVKMFSQDEPV